MINKKYIIVLAVLIFALSSTLLCAKVAKKLNIYLPRQVQAKDSAILLGQIAVLSGQPETIAAAEGISLGKLTMPGQIIKLDRNTVLSRLASNGINKRYVSFSGAETAQVKLKAETIPVNRIVDVSDKLLSQNFQSRDDVVWTLIADTKPFIVEYDINDLEIKADFSTYGNNDKYKTVIVSLVKDNKTIDQRKLRYQLSYKCNQLIAKTNIPSGTIISRDSVEVQEVILRNRSSQITKEPYGMIARRDIRAGQTILNSYFAEPKPVKIVKRNQTVIVMLRSAGLVLSVPGQALQDGFANDLVKVKVTVTDQDRTIVARVLENGTVEPVI